MSTADGGSPTRLSPGSPTQRLPVAPATGIRPQTLTTDQLFQHTGAASDRRPAACPGNPGQVVLRFPEIEEIETTADQSVFQTPQVVAAIRLSIRIDFLTADRR